MLFKSIIKNVKYRLCGIRKINRLSVKICLLCLGSLTVMCTGAIAPALPTIQKHYSYLPNVDILTRMLVTITHISIAISSSISGLLVNKFDRRKMLFIFLSIYFIGGFSGVFVNNIYILLSLRVVLGVAVGFIIVIANTLIADYFDGAERTAFFGIQVTLMSIGTVISTVLSGILADINWRLVFLIYSFGLIVMFFVYRVIFDPNVKQKDTANNRNFININIAETNKKSFVVQNNSVIAMLLLISIFNMIAYYLIPLQLPFILYSLGSMNAKKVSMVLALETAIAAWFSMKHKRVNKNHSFPSICTFALFFMSLSYFIVVHFPNYYFIMFSMILYGLGMGLMMPNNSLWIISTTKPHNRGIVLGMLSTSIFLGKAISPFIVYFISKKMPIIKLFSIFATIMLFIGVFVIFFYEYSSAKSKPKPNETPSK